MVTPTVTPPPGLPADADVLGRAGGENFTVASRLLPAPSRAHLLAFYGYARLIDQLGDAYDGDRTAALDWAETELAAALDDPADPSRHRLIAAAAASVRALGADPGPLHALIEANRMDQTGRRYATFSDLLGYCRLSADPVGRLVLAAFGAATPANEACSDAVCSGLQVAEHLQDLAEDTRAGRIYLPTEDLERFGLTVGDLEAAADDPASPAAAATATARRAVVAFEASRARDLLRRGVPLVAALSGRSRLAVAGFVAGGLATLDALAAAGYSPWETTPRPSGRAVARHSLALLRGARR